MDVLDNFRREFATNLLFGIDVLVSIQLQFPLE